jgi:branched-chain amino acid transport system substrate-binding protein
MAVKTINAKGGIKIKDEKYDLKLIILDDQLDPTKAVKNARRMREQNQAIAIFSGIVHSTYALMNVNTEKGHEFIIMGYITSPGVAKAGNPLSLCIPPVFSVYAKIEAEWAIARGYRKAGIVLASDLYGQEWMDCFSKYYEKLGGKITAVKPANYYAETDYSAQLTAVLATKPDVMLIGGPSATTALVIEQARNLGYKGGFCLIDQAQIDQIHNILRSYKLLSNSVGVSTVAALPSAITPWFEKTFREYNKGAQYNWEVILHYGAALALVKAIEAADTTDVLAVRKAFAKAYPILGNEVPIAVFGLTDDGRQKMAASIQEINEDGKLEDPKQAVWWAKSDKEFNDVKKALQDPKNIGTHKAPEIIRMTAEE